MPSLVAHCMDEYLARQTLNTYGMDYEMNANSDSARIVQEIVRRCAFWLILLIVVIAAPRDKAFAGRRGSPANDNSSNAQPSAPTPAESTATTTPAPTSSKSVQPPLTSTKSKAAKSSTVNTNNPKPDAVTAGTTDLSADAIAAQIRDLEAATDADRPDRATLLTLFRQALDDVKRVDEQKARTADLEKQRIATPYLLEIRKRENAARPATQPAAPAAISPLPKGATLAVWEQMLGSAEQELQTAQKTADDKQQEQQRRAARRLEIPQTIAAARMKLDELEQTPPESATSADDTAAIIDARHIAHQAQRLALETEISLLEKEVQTYNAVAAELLSLERDAADETADAINKRLTVWREAVNNRREVEADQQASEARLAAVTAVPAIRQLANENSDLASRRAQLTKAIEQLAAQRDAVVARLEKVSDQFKQATDKLTATGLTQAVGQMLLKERSDLAVVEADRRAVQLRQQEIARVQLELFEFQEQLADLHNLDSRVEELRASLPTAAEAKPDDLRRLLETKRKYLEALVEDDNLYFSDLVEIDSNERELLNQADGFRDYIDQRVLWIRSTHPVSLADAGKTAGGVVWLARPANWWASVREFADAVRSSAGLSLLAALLFVFWALAQRRLRIVIQNCSQQSLADGNLSAHSELRRACHAAVATLLIATIWPALIWFVGWLLVGGSAIHGEFPEALGRALQITAATLLPLLLIRQICRHDGLAEAHFGWPRDPLLSLRRQLTWLAIAGTPAMIIVTMFEAQSTEAWNDSLGRLTFIAGQLLTASFVFTVLRPPHGALHRLMVLRSDSWTSRLSLPTFLVMFTAPLALAALAITGYHYTALHLACRLLTTVWLVLGLVIAQSLISIWLTGVYRRLAIKTAARIANPARRFMGSAQAGLAASLQQQRETNSDDGSMSEVDLEIVDAQTQELLHNLATLALAVGLCLIWVDMFPALRFFNQITLWGDSGSGAAITLGNLLEAAVVAALALVAARNLPSLLDVAVLQHLMPDRGSRYALVAVIRYSIVVIGVAAAGATVGIGWTKLQWLIAAMSFGLGFGLQEIFANFVSGLIVLFERPVRVGDTVTIGDVTGVVSRIKMRATTIIDADRKELIIPNKDLVSGRLVNWTLTDSVVRLVVRLGIAYGSDTAQTQRLLLEVATKTPEVLKTPPPKAVFMGFGEKSLEFELRVFVNSVEAMLPVRHQLNMAIDRTFHVAGVEIAFAQADTYIRSGENNQVRSPANPFGSTSSLPQKTAQADGQKAA
jgi:potassium-dependent mechanosensitive channel